MQLENMNIEELEKYLEEKKEYERILKAEKERQQKELEKQQEVQKEKEPQEKSIEKTKKKKKKRMKFSKKLLVAYFAVCAILVIFTMAMIVMGKDTTSLTILAGAGVGGLVVMTSIYDHYETKINLKHMEKNYIPGYDEYKNQY